MIRLSLVLLLLGGCAGTNQPANPSGVSLSWKRLEYTDDLEQGVRCYRWEGSSTSGGISCVYLDQNGVNEEEEK